LLDDSDVTNHRPNGVAAVKGGFSRRLPFRGLLFQLGQRHDVPHSVLQRHELLIYPSAAGSPAAAAAPEVNR
jgi:hypothetical protein